MARTQVQSELLAVNSISGTIIADNAITATHIATNAISGTLVQDGGIVTVMIAANNVTATKIVTDAVQTRHIADDQVTAAKLANSINTDIATGPAALPKAGGTLTGDIAHAGNFTLDVEGVIKLDANGAEIQIKDGGTEIGAINMASSNLNIESKVANKNILFKGIDGSSDVTALTLNMASAGAATFNAGATFAGQIISAGGAVSAPTYSFTGDTDTGISRPTTNALNFVTAGTERVRINASGNVGIGVTPEANWRSSVKALDLGATGAFWDGHNYSIFANNIYEHTDTNRKHKQSGFGSSIEQYLGTINFTTTTSGSADATISGSTTMFINTSGNVGIGETAPLGRLHVKNADSGVTSPDAGFDDMIVENSADVGISLLSSDTGTIAFNDANGAPDGSLQYRHDDRSMRFSIGGTERMRISNNGFVGIGDTGVTSSVSGAAGPVLRLEGNNPEIVFSDDAGTANQLGLYYLNNVLYFHSPQKSGGAGTVMSLATTSGNLGIAGALSKGSGSFKIDHPLEAKKDTHHLVHSFVEAPQADNIYRGTATLSSGTATINLDTVSGMTEGTYVLLNTNTSCFTSNETDWDAVKGSVSGNTLTITCQNDSSTATVSWLVIGERHDQHMKDTDWTNADGTVIVEPLKG